MKLEPLAVRVSDAADAIGVSRSTCYNLIATGQLSTIRVGRRATRVTMEALRAFILDRQVATAPDGPSTGFATSDILAAGDDGGAA